MDAISVDAEVFLFALGLTTLIGVVVGFVSNVQASGSDVQSAARQSSARMTGSRHWTRRTLVVTEVSLAVVLLVSAGLLLRSMERLFAVDPGFETSNLITMQVRSAHGHGSDAMRPDFYRQVLDKIRNIPGVVSAGMTSQLPLSGDQDVYGIQFEIAKNPLGEAAFRYAVSPGYLETMKIPLRRGRMLNEHDTAGAPVAVLITESLARRIFSGTDPSDKECTLGRTLGAPTGRGQRLWGWSAISSRSRSQSPIRTRFISPPGSGRG
jgi:putative ABC transport system permease protein